jgi:hypothetical protein
VTVVQSVGAGVHIGSTLKYVRGRLRTGAADGALGASGALHAGDEFEGGDAQGRFDLDIGVLAVQGPVRGGAVMRNVRKPAFTAADGGASFEMPRQVRLGAAFDGDSMGLPLTVSFDADVRRYVTASGDRRVLAVGAEHWLFRRRIGVRAGGRFNRVGVEDRAATGGVSVKLRSGLYLDGHIVRGGNADDRGWGMAARVSF